MKSKKIVSLLAATVMLSGGISLLGGFDGYEEKVFAENTKSLSQGQIEVFFEKARKISDMNNASGNLKLAVRKNILPATKDAAELQKLVKQIEVTVNQIKSNFLDRRAALVDYYLENFFGVFERVLRGEEIKDEDINIIKNTMVLIHSEYPQLFPLREMRTEDSEGDKKVRELQMEEIFKETPITDTQKNAFSEASFLLSFFEEQYWADDFISGLISIVSDFLKEERKKEGEEPSSRITFDETGTVNPLDESSLSDTYEEEKLDDSKGKESKGTQTDADDSKNKSSMPLKKSNSSDPSKTGAAAVDPNKKQKLNNAKGIAPLMDTEPSSIKGNNIGGKGGGWNDDIFGKAGKVPGTSDNFNMNQSLFLAIISSITSLVFGSFLISNLKKRKGSNLKLR
ncbi:MAG: hypothetical protein LBI55_03280 [Oscillospiraceae bacterium]|jgi:hypothetical protein|nr:hypothetical protein [Oscillospiraceae bacterium]